MVERARFRRLVTAVLIGGFCLVLTGASEPSARAGESAVNYILDIYAGPAARGDPKAQYFLGLMYDQGLEGVEPQPGRAADWYERAAVQGHPQAQHRLAVLLQTGRGVPRDLERAAELYRQAASQGVLESQFNLAQMMETGQGMEAAPWVAKEIYETAAEAGLASAMGALGRLYARGVGVEQDLARAWAWLSRATEEGDRLASELLGPVEDAMTPEELARARELAERLR